MDEQPKTETTWSDTFRLMWEAIRAKHQSDTKTPIYVNLCVPVEIFDAWRNEDIALRKNVSHLALDNRCGVCLNIVPKELTQYA